MRDDLPSSVPAFISESPDGHINIYLNSRLSRAKQREGLKHEIDHHERDDLHNGKDIRSIENRDRPEKKKDLPPLFRASDLLMNALPEPEIHYKRKVKFDARYEPHPTKHDIPPEQLRPAPAMLSPYQKQIALQALSALDLCFFENDRALENRMIMGDDY